MADFKELVGKTLKSVSGSVGDDRIVFTTDDDQVFKLYHDQDCCESVSVESITGDLSDLIGSPILQAEESSSSDTPKDFKHSDEPESQTWTFYKLATYRGYVDIRWFGSSNGYYSESVCFTKVTH